MGQEQAIIRATQMTKQPSGEPQANHGWRLRIMALPATALFLIAAWTIRTGNYYEPGDNFGYYLGVVGGLMILALLFYSLRKHIHFMRNWGPTKQWFRLHMIFGIAGPTLILFHSTFHVGSMNAAVALACMLLVASSGIVGRFIYRKIHHGLYGRNATLQDIQTNLGINQGDVKSKFHFSPKIEQQLKQFETSTLATRVGARQRIWSFISIGFYASWTYFMTTREMNRFIRHHSRQQDWDSAKRDRRLAHGKIAIRKYLDAVIDVARFNAYEQLFSLWHILHVPFVSMLVISGIVHVIAVHMY